jgi:hypothetical protein
MANTELKNAQSDVLLSDIAQGATTATLTGGNFGTPATQIYLTFDYDVAAKYEVKKATVAGSSVTSMTHVSGANVAHTAGCKIGRMINAEVIKDITDITDNHETRIAAEEGKTTALETTVNVGGWITGPALTFGAADSPTFTATHPADVTSKIYPGVRVKADQTQAIQNYWSFDVDSRDDKGGATMANVGTPTYTAGKFSNALTLNGTNQALSITDAVALHLGASGAPFTLGMWFKTSNAGATKWMFQSYVDNTNANGVRMYIDAANKIVASTGNNATDPTTVITGTTTVTDGNWHYVVWSYKDNYTQIYLDGKLEASGYNVTPTYTATTYIRIGVADIAGASVAGTWFNGQIDDLFIAAYALDEQTIAAKYAAATAQGTGDLTLTKYFLCTASSYSAPNTTVTLYGGTDHTLANATISNAYYSTQKAPYGFPLGADKWSVEYANNVGATQPTPTSGTWYNSGGSFSLPIGNWNIFYVANCGLNDASATGCSLRSTLSNANNSEAYPTFSVGGIQYVVAGQTVSAPYSAVAPLSTKSKMTAYLNLRSSTASIDNISIYSALIRATSTLL